MVSVATPSGPCCPDTMACRLLPSRPAVEIALVPSAQKSWPRSLPPSTDPPVPVSVSVAVPEWCLPAAVSVPVTAPAWAGANRTVTWHLRPGRRLRQVVRVMVNAAEPSP